MSTETAARAPFAPETAVVINFGGKAGIKEGFVVTDEGGAKIEVRYETTRGEQVREVKAELVSPVADEHAVDETPVDDVPVVDINDTEISDEEAEAIMIDNADAEAKALLDAETPEDETPAPKVEGPKDRDLLSHAQDLVIQHGPAHILTHGLPETAKTWQTPEGDELVLTDDQLATLTRHALYQAGRVLIFFGRPKPEGHDARRYA